MPVLILNFVVFQLTWFTCVLGGAWGWPWAGVGAAAAAVGVHGLVSPDFVREAKLLAAAAVIGFVWDSSLVAAGLVVYPSGQLASVLAPVWIVALWVGFATCINVSLRWLKARWIVAAVLGAVAGPASFWGGSRLGAVSFPDPVLALSVLAVGWGVLTPLVVWLGERFDGWHPDLIPGRGR